MPRLTDARREARRAEMVAAARRCFARDGFHQTSMPDIAAEAGLSAGAFYRYFPSKDDIVVEVAGQAFDALFAPVSDGAQGSAADLVAAAAAPLGDPSADVDEMLRCGVAAWAELLRNEAVHERAATGVDRVRERLAATLRRGRDAGTAPAGLDPDDGARVLIALLHGFLLQRVAFGLDSPDGVERFVAAARALLGAQPSPGADPHHDLVRPTHDAHVRSDP